MPRVHALRCSYSLNTAANSVLPASVVATYVCLQPLFGVATSSLWPGVDEPLQWKDLGGVGIALGLLCMNWPSLWSRGDGSTAKA